MKRKFLVICVHRHRDNTEIADMEVMHGVEFTRGADVINWIAAEAFIDRMTDEEKQSIKDLEVGHWVRVQEAFLVLAYPAKWKSIRVQDSGVPF